MDSPLAVTAVSAFGVHDRQRGSTAGSGVLRSSTPGAGTHLQRPRLGTAHLHSVPDTRELNLTLTGEKIAKTPPAGILSPMPSMVSDQSEKTHSPSLNMRPPTHMRESATSDGFGELTCKEALKHIKRKRERARKQQSLTCRRTERLRSLSSASSWTLRDKWIENAEDTNMDDKNSDEYV